MFNSCAILLADGAEFGELGGVQDPAFEAHLLGDRAQQNQLLGGAEFLACDLVVFGSLGTDA
ncbi:MAG: hypothetical protein HC902_06505 [Calothrix sp. SM1_5_4]|nr:hypothetical protein [Calothrix sp. SM1_5_4]